MNTRRFPRTLNEAFPGTVDYACAVERFDRTSHAVATGVAVVILAALLTALWIGAL